MLGKFYDERKVVEGAFVDRADGVVDEVGGDEERESKNLERGQELERKKDFKLLCWLSSTTRGEPLLRVLFSIGLMDLKLK